MIVIAMDRATVRRTSAYGHLRVERSNISKANICPYYGQEIPGWRELGLDPERVYRMFRDPEELAKAVDTFNGLPLLNIHIPVTADAWPEDAVVGSSGTDAQFDGQYLTNSLVVWTRGAIDGIESGRRRELSCGYGYTPDMTPGIHGGLPYDGVMREIVGNHITLVVEGRAGPDVLVGDETMKSRRAILLSGAVAGYIAPLLAKDAKFDLKPLLSDVTAKSIAMDGAPAALAEKIVEAVKPHLAEDKSADGLADVIGYAASIALDGDDEIPDATPTPTPSPAPAAKPEDKPAPAALDEATVNKRIADAVAASEAKRDAIETAKAEVAPHVGAVVGDTAEDIYKIALDAKKVDLAGIDPTAYRGMVRMLPKQGDRPAMDARTVKPSSHLAIIAPEAARPIL